MEGNLDILSEPELSRAEAAALMLRTVLAEEGLEHMADCVRESHLDNDSIAWAEDDDFEDFDIPMAVGKRLRAGLRRHMGHPPLPDAEPKPELEAGRSKAERKRAKRERQRANKRLAEEQQDAQREATAAKITRALTAHFEVRLFGQSVGSECLSVFSLPFGQVCLMVLVW